METFERTLSRWCTAEARGDVAALDALLDAEFCGDDPDGRVLDKAQWLARGRRGVWTPDELRVHQRTAVAMGVHGARRFTLVAVRRGERWTIVNVQLGAIQPPGDRQITQLADVPSAAPQEPSGIADRNQGGDHVRSHR